MQYIKNGRWASGRECNASTRLPVWGYPVDIRAESEERPEYFREDIDERHDACGCFCDEFCSRFCPLFSCDFCSEVRDHPPEEKCKKCGCRRRVRLETCRQVACRTCVKVFCEMGRVCPSNFCPCFAADFCREFCEAFKAVRKRLCECRHDRPELCREGCLQICEKVCPCVCRRHCCQVPLI